MDTSIRNLTFDLLQGKEIFDSENDRIVSPAEANDTIRKYCFEVLGLDEKSTERDIKRALKKPEAQVVFNIVEENLDKYIATGWKDNEFFNDFVEERNTSDGDLNEFWTEDDIILNVAKVAGDHHDLVVQKLGKNSSFTIPTSVYSVKVGTDIRLFLTGRRDWNDFIEAVGKAFIKKIQDEIYTEFMNGASKLPVPDEFVGTGTLDADSKEDFDEIISNVGTANESEVVIMGTKTALKKLNGLAGANGVNWIAGSQKESVAHTGILGDYEGVTLVEIPQRFANNDVATKLVDNTKLLIFPIVDYKPVKFVDYGETSLEKTERGDTMNDQQIYEVQRRMGVGTIITRYFGQWTLE